MAAQMHLVEDVLRVLHERAEKRPTWKHVVWHCCLSVIAQTQSMWGKKPVGECNGTSLVRPLAEEGAGWWTVSSLQTRAGTLGMCP